jgi:superoxide dismutase
MRKKFEKMSDEELEHIISGGKRDEMPTNEKNMQSLSDQELHDIAYQNESKGWGGVLSDVAHKGLESIINLPSNLKSLGSELSGAANQITSQGFNPVKMEPFANRALRNIGAGIPELGHKILSAPGELRDYLVKKDIASEQSPSFRLPESVLPKDYNYAEAFGVQGNQPGDALLQALPGLLASAPLAKMLPSTTKAITSGIKEVLPQNAYKFIQRAYDAKENNLSNSFNEIAKAAESEGVKVKLPKKLIENIIEAGPKTERFKTFVDKAKTGDYKALRKLQTELFHRGKRNSKSILGSDQDLGEILFEQRDKINNEIMKALHKSKQPELAQQLSDTRAGWKQLEETYHKNPTISKLVGEEREVPFTYKPLRKESASINRLKEEHPQIQRKLRNSAIMKALGTSAAAGAYGLYRGSKPSSSGYDYND